MEIPVSFSPPMSQNYTVYVDAFSPLTCKGKVAIVTDESVKKLHLDWLLQRINAPEVHVISLPQGETHKTLSTVDMILDNLLEKRFDRSSTLIAFGGGIVGDMTGFAAAIFQRGIDFIQIPTTLLAQVDASVGGKTGVNTKWGKNLIGAFHQPRAVYCESRFLTTLPPREIGAGIAEIIKMAITFDKEFVGFLETNNILNPEHLRYAIAKSVAIKAQVVVQDEKETGIRAVLNYGHTFGHVIENQSGYTRFLHGEAVAIGMRMANALACKLGLINSEEEVRISKLLTKYGLNFSYSVDNPDKFYDAFFLDKKSRNMVITFILPKGIGGYERCSKVPKEDVVAMLAEFDR
jgi:3-dehydroquinate synthase